MGRRVQKLHRNKSRSGTGRKQGKSHLRIFLLFIVFILLGIPMLYTAVTQEVAPVAAVDDAMVDEKIKAEGLDLKIVEKDGYTITPTFREPVKGVIIYPHKGVSPKAYVPLAMILANKGYLVVIPSFLLNSPELAGNVIEEIIREHEEISFWALAGHGSGGEAMSSYLAADEKIKGAIFMASYPDETADLSESGLKVVSIMGSLDTQTDKKGYESSKVRLPEGTMFVRIEGGNFSYFAYYEDEHPGEISREEQQVQASVQIFNILDQLR